MFEWSKHFGYGTMTSVLKKRRVVSGVAAVRHFRHVPTHDFKTQN